MNATFWSLFNAKGKTTRGNARRQTRACKPRLEALEDRCLLATGAILWSNQFEPIDAPEGATAIGECIALHATGVYMTGTTGGALPGQTQVGSFDAYVRRYDRDGNVLWTQQFGTEFSDFAHGISVDDSGVYVVGNTDGTFPGQISTGNGDIFVRKYDFDGNEIWTQQFGAVVGSGSVGSSGSAIHADVSGIYLTGSTYGTLPGQSSAGLLDAFLRKYDKDGNALWTRQFGSALYDTANAISVDSSGIYVAGASDATPGNPAGDIYVRKYDADGNDLWTRQFGSALNDSANAISVDASGLYVAGFTNGTLPGQSSAGDYDAFLCKYSVDGNEIWTRQFGTSGLDAATGLAVSPSGVYVSGNTFGTLPGQTSVGGRDALVRKYDTDGNEVGTFQFGTVADDGGRDIAVDVSGIYIGGTTNGTLPGQTSSGSYNPYMAKIGFHPTITLAGPQTGYEDVDQAITGINVSDVDSSTLTVNLTVGHGTLTLGTTAGLTVTGSGSGSVSLSGSIAALNAALASLHYQGTLNFSGADTLNIMAGDGSLSSSGSVAITVKSAAQQVANLNAQVDALVAAGVLNNGQGRTLHITLKNNNGDAGRVNTLLSQVQDFLNAGILTQAQADALKAAGNLLLLSVSRR